MRRRNRSGLGEVAFGEVVYSDGGYIEYVLSASHNAKVVACCRNDTIVMYRIEWMEGNLFSNAARYTLSAAILLYNEKKDWRPTAPVVEVQNEHDTTCQYCHCTVLAYTGYSYTDVSGVSSVYHMICAHKTKERDAERSVR